MIKQIALSFVFLLICLKSFNQQEISGYVYDSSHKPLSGVAISDTKHKFLGNSNDSGTFKITLKSANTLCFRLVGYVDTCISIEVLHATNKIILTEKIVESKEVIVKANDGSAYLKSVQTGLFQFKPDSLRSLPSIVGEADPLRMLQLSPGVAKSEINMGINVRGSSADQNMVLFNDAVIYNPTHLMGFLSIFNPLVVENVSLIKSGLPAYYGGRLSSVTDVQSYKSIPDSAKFCANVGLLLSGFMYKVPLCKNKLAITIAARSSYIDYTIKPVSRFLFKRNRSLFNFTDYGFYDVNAEVIYKPTVYDGIYVSFYKGNDNFSLKKASFEIQNNVDWNNEALSVKWLHNRSATHSVKTVAAYSGNSFEFSLVQSNLGYWLTSDMKNLSFLHEHSFYFRRVMFKTGVQQEIYSVLPSHNQASIDAIKAVIGTPNTYHNSATSIYLHSEIEMTRRLKIAIGMRGSTFYHFGPYTTYVYDFAGNVSDTLQYKINQTIRNYNKVEPRFSLSYTVDSNSWIKASATRNVQYIQQVNVTAVALPMDFWLPSTNGVAPATGYQFSAGYFKKFHQGFNGSVDIFYKNMSNLLEFNSGILTALAKTTLEQSVISGSGRAYGMEFFIEKKSGQLTGWISYTLSRTERMFSQIDNGNPYPTKYDHTNDLAVVLQYPLNDKWKASAIFVYTTGNAFTLPTGRYIISGNIVNQNGPYNSFRLPAYHRLDVAFTRKIKKTNHTEQNLNFGIYNVYSRLNPYYMYFNVTGDLKTSKLYVSLKSVSIFPMLPSVSYEIRF